MSRLADRLARLQARLDAQEKPIAVLLASWLTPPPASEDELTAPVDEHGNARVSRYCLVSFIHGSRAARQRMLEELRADPLYQQPRWESSPDRKNRERE